MSASPRERPIIFSGDEVRAVLEGKKTQARRVVKPQPSTRAHYLQPMWGTSPDGFAFGDKWVWREVGPDYPDDDRDDRRCPFGVPGDRLWVRETMTWIRGNGIRPWYRADGEEPLGRDGQPLAWEPGERRWIPSMLMSRRLSRITLEITDVRAERLQDISAEDARAEGYGTVFGPGMFSRAFDSHWDAVNGERAPWSSNPFVWALTFLRLP